MVFVEFYKMDVNILYIILHFFTLDFFELIGGN